MNDPPLVSVVLIFLNERRFLAEAVESVIAQTYQHWELWLVDDGSSDESTQIAREYARQQPGRIFYLEHHNHSNRGMSASRNLGFRHANGTLMALIDADDFWLPDKLREQVAIMQAHPEASLLYGLAEYWRDWSGEGNGRARNSIPTVPRLDYLSSPPDLAISAYPLGDETAPCPSCMIFRRDMIERIGGFEESFRGMFEDQAFLAKVYLNEPIYVASNVWIRYRVHPDSCCSQVHAAGEYDYYRHFFLKWLAKYMFRKRKFYPRVWRALFRALKPYGLISPLSGRVSDRATN